MTQRISDSSAIGLNRARTMAPSQQRKMVKMGITSAVFPSTVRKDFTKNGLQFMATEDRIIFVQSKKFPGWFYLVRWTRDGIDECTCGKPHGCEHTRAACAFTAQRHESDVQREQTEETEMLTGMASVADRLIARLKAAEHVEEVA